MRSAEAGAASGSCRSEPQGGVQGGKALTEGRGWARAGRPRPVQQMSWRGHGDRARGQSPGTSCRTAKGGGGSTGRARPGGLPEALDLFAPVRDQGLLNRDSAGSGLGFAGTGLLSAMCGGRGWAGRGAVSAGASQDDPAVRGWRGPGGRWSHRHRWRSPGSECTCRAPPAGLADGLPETGVVEVPGPGPEHWSSTQWSEPCRSRRHWGEPAGCCGSGQKTDHQAARAGQKEKRFKYQTAPQALGSWGEPAASEETRVYRSGSPPLSLLPVGQASLLRCHVTFTHLASAPNRWHVGEL